MKAFVVLKPILIFSFAVTNNNNSKKKSKPTIRLQNNKKGRNIWYIDGYNVLGHAGTSNNVTTLIQQLQQIQPHRGGSGINTVILVLDGPKSKTNKNETVTDTAIAASTSIERFGHFYKVVLGEGLLADDYIINEIRTMSTTSRTGGSIDNNNNDENDTQNQLDNGTLLYDNKNDITKIAPTIQQESFDLSLMQRNIVQVVTADRTLRQQILNIKNPIKVRGVINPVTFFKRYIPRLSGMKVKS